jgi:hypothetical protein
MSAVAGVPQRFWKWNGPQTAVIEMNPTEKAAVRAQRLSEAKAEKRLEIMGLVARRLARDDSLFQTVAVTIAAAETIVEVGAITFDPDPPEA